MNKLVFLFLVFVSFVTADIAIAQSDLRLFASTQTTTQTVGTENFGIADFRVDNVGSEASPRFKVRMWLSVENSFNSNDLQSDDQVQMSATGVNPSGGFTSLRKDDDGFFPRLEPTALVGRVRVNRVSSTARYNLPLAEDVTPAGNLKPLSDILANRYFFQACIVFEGSDDCDPDPKHNATASTLLVPPVVNFAQTRFLNDDPNIIKFVWPEVPFDNYVDDAGVQRSVNFVDEYRVWWMDQNGVQNSRAIAIADLNIYTPGEPGQREFIITSEDLGLTDVGKRYAFRVESCTTVDGDTPFLGCQANRPRNVTGSEQLVTAIQQTFVASQATNNEGILVQFDRPQASTPRYIVERCEANGSNCIRTQIEPNPANEYLDTSAVRGRDYTYNLYACDTVNGGTGPTAGLCNERGFYVYQFGTTNVGQRGLVDDFEIDDTPGQAKLVRSSTSQLRSFHTESDDDWVRVDLNSISTFSVSTSAFESNNVDTVLSLYVDNNGALELLAENDDLGEIASFSIIEPMRLAAGTYFVKATHFKLVPDGGGDPIIPAPVIPNYRLNFIIDSQRPVNLVPIIELLLSDD